MVYYLLFLFVLLFVQHIFLRRVKLKGKIERDAERAENGAREEFMNWYFKNPGVYIGLSEEGRRLLARYIETWDEYLITHKYISDNGHRASLVSLFNDLPPKQPRRKKIPAQQSRAA